VDSHDVRREWAERSGEFSPDYYAYYGPNAASESIRGVLDAHCGPDARVLEVGCSAGRHLAHLLEHGYERLTGIDVNPDARAVMRDAYPELAAAGTFHFEAVEDVVETFDDGAFDAVYSVETLQHIHPDADWVFAELARITADLLVTVENEPDGDGAGVNFVSTEIPLYYRDWSRVFEDLGLVEVDVAVGDRDTMRTFRTPAAVDADAAGD
jgi:SAM-dependent methyltransferase